MDREQQRFRKFSPRDIRYQSSIKLELAMLDKDFSSDKYSAILANLKDNGYLAQEDIDVLINDSFEKNAVVFTNINEDKAEIVRKAILENSKRRKF